MDRNQVERTLRGAYEARLSGDMGAMENAFAPDAQFELAGAPATSPIPGCCQGAEAIRSRLQALVDAFEMSNLEIVSWSSIFPRSRCGGGSTFDPGRPDSRRAPNFAT